MNSKTEMTPKSYDDYKYVLQDTSNLYLGAKYTYSELIHDEDVPFKFKTIVERYLMRDLNPDTTLASLFYYMKADGFDYECCRQLKVKLKVSILSEKKNLFGQTKKGYRDELFSIKDFVAKDKEWKEARGIFIQEIQISKMSLLMFAA